MAAETVSTRYEIIETVPEGDTLPFTVAKARDTAEDRIVTLQTLPAERIAAGPVLRAAFLAAAQQAGRLDHPNITRLYDQGTSEEGQALFVAGEYVRGITLKERIRRIAPFSLAVAADIAVAVAEALEYAHGAGVPHGDLRPHQILLSPEGQIKVAGFAYSLAAVQLTADGLDPLYAAYAAPELGPRAAGSVAADIYALGATLYEMLTGAQPARGGETPPSPRSLNPGVPPALEGIVQKALQPQPLSRYRSATAMLADLRTVREALRTGRSLAWTPTGERRIPREPDSGPAVIPATPADTTRTQVVARPASPVAEEDDDGPDYSPGRAASRAFGIIVGILFVVAVCGIIGLTWYFTRFIAIPNDVQVPNLIGKTYDEAQQIADRDHFQLVERDPDTPHYSVKWPQNQIYQQDPPAERTIKAGRQVFVLRSAGPPLLPVPDLTGMTQDRATRAFGDADTPPLGTVTEDYSDTVPAGIVLSQQPAPHTMVARGVSVNFVVSRGAEPPDVPADVTATPADPTTITLTWTPSARAKTYTVTRSQDGDTRTVAQGLTVAKVTDSGLTPGTSYTYTVSAVNSGGSSGDSDPVPAITPPIVSAPPTLNTDTLNNPTGTPDNTGNPDNSPASTGSADNGSPRLRQFTINFHVPRHPKRQRHVQFEIQDALGLSQAFDEYRDPGSEVDAPVHAFGNRVTFRIFLDGKLVKQQTQ